MNKRMAYPFASDSDRDGRPADESGTDTAASTANAFPENGQIFWELKQEDAISSRLYVSCNTTQCSAL